MRAARRSAAKTIDQIAGADINRAFDSVEDPKVRNHWRNTYKDADVNELRDGVRDHLVSKRELPEAFKSTIASKIQSLDDDQVRSLAAGLDASRRGPEGLKSMYLSETTPLGPELEQYVNDKAVALTKELKVKVDPRELKSQMFADATQLGGNPSELILNDYNKYQDRLAAVSTMLDPFKEPGNTYSGLKTSEDWQNQINALKAEDPKASDMLQGLMDKDELPGAESYYKQQGGEMLGGLVGSLEPSADVPGLFANTTNAIPRALNKYIWDPAAEKGTQAMEYLGMDTDKDKLIGELGGGTSGVAAAKAAAKKALAKAGPRVLTGAVATPYNVFKMTAGLAMPMGEAESDYYYRNPGTRASHTGGVLGDTVGGFWTGNESARRAHLAMKDLTNTAAMAGVAGKAQTEQQFNDAASSTGGMSMLANPYLNNKLETLEDQPIESALAGDPSRPISKAQAAQANLLRKRRLARQR
jgi:hypothetical protein